MQKKHAIYSGIHQGNGRILLVLLSENSPQRRKGWVNQSLGRTAQG